MSALFRVSVASNEADKAEALLTLAGATALTFDDASDSPILEPGVGETPLWPIVRLSAQFSEAVDVDALAQLMRNATESAHAIESAMLDATWEDRLHGDFEPSRVGDRLLIVPCRDQTGAAAGGGRAVIRLRMGRAFGTGRHATTRLCLEWLEREFRGGTVLDYGSGSGILSVAACALGAERVYAADNDPQAVASTRDNAALNGFEDRLSAFAPEDLPALEASLIVANILASTLLELEREFAACLEPGAAVVLSGILESQADEIERVYASHFDAFDRETLDGWIRIAAVRNGFLADRAAGSG